MAKKIIFILIASAVGAGVILFAFLFYVNVFIKKAPTFENRKFPSVLHTIEKGTNFDSLAKDLEQKDLINSRFWFDGYFLLSGRWSRIKAGTYDLPYGSTTAQLGGIISRGEIKKEKITILEGWNLKDIAQYCEQKGYFSQDEFFESAGDPTKGTVAWFKTTTSTASAKEKVEYTNIFHKIAGDFGFLFGTNATSASNDAADGAYDLEGYLFPDTYEFVLPITPETVIRKALNNFQEKVPADLRAGNFYQTMIMASLLEKEVKTYKDKQIVAGILWKRLKEGWPLQVDSTLNYAMAEPSAKLLLSDLDFDSPYNTYRNKGLPPTPICNPGLESIKAAVYYEDSPYWYYLSDKNGKTIFSKTFEQHKAAKARYLK
ncbi:MAG: endolytic transglycosylase MltG [Candidatus Pacebacteria bacterium]|nr:endolytic transglycosylase MltG [Candidatus Paceibacterota bacterium]